MVQEQREEEGQFDFPFPFYHQRWVLDLLYYFLCVSVLSVSLYTMCMPGVQGGQERTLGSLGLKSQMVVSYHVGAGD